MPLYVVEKLVKGVTVLDLMGEIRLGQETAILRDRIRGLVELGNSQIVLDLKAVHYIDSVGLSTLVASHTSASKRGGQVKLLNLTKRVHDLLQITRLITVFETFDNLDAALSSFSPSPK